MAKKAASYTVLSRMPKLHCPSDFLLTVLDLCLDALRFIPLSLLPRCALAGEKLSPRKQATLYLERQIKPRRARLATRLTFAY